ncbi:hypothetical protein HK100_011072, partial [Physocladia obscura]
FDTTVALTIFHNAQIAIFKDPNGIEVRLIELTEQQQEDSTIAESDKRQWFARVGYYTIPTAKIELTGRYFERIFACTSNQHNSEKVAAVGGGGGRNKHGGGGMVAENIVKTVVGKGKKNTGEELSKNSNIGGIRIVDTEEYVIGLTKTQFLWLSHEPRCMGTSICFTGKLIAESHEVRQCDRSSSQLLAIGIEVPSLDALLKRWEWERPNEVSWEPGRFRISGIGQFGKFIEPNNNITVEIFTPKIIDPAEVQRENAAAAAAAVIAANEKAEKLRKLKADLLPPKSHTNDEIAKITVSKLVKAVSESALVPINSHRNAVEMTEETLTPLEINPLPQDVKVKLRNIKVSMSEELQPASENVVKMKLNQKLEKLKIEAEQNGERANGFKAEVKELKAVIAEQEVDIKGLHNKVKTIPPQPKKLETEKAELETKHEELTVVHTALKGEFEETLKSLEAL